MELSQSLWLSEEDLQQIWAVCVSSWEEESHESLT